MVMQPVARIPCMHPTAAVVIITQSPPSQHSPPRETAADNVSWIICRDVALLLRAPAGPSSLSVGAARPQHPHHLSSARGDQRLA